MKYLMPDMSSSSNEEKKIKIRERYKGISTENLDIIPAIPPEDFYDSSSTKRVGVYARVSTDDPRQTTSYELQKNHYQDMIERRPDWQLVNIYADEGISGTSLKHRNEFIKMISDCESKKIDLIVTKSVARFARNVVDCIGYVRALAAMNPPVGVFFETENIFTLNPNAEMSLSFISTLAQEESHTKSEIMNSSIEMRFQRGIFLLPVLLGYDHDENENFIINEAEARIVRLIFYMYYSGHSSLKIAELLTKLQCTSKRGNISWSSGVILSILQNERYCGDVLARKTWTPNYLNHKSRKNRQDRNQYLQKNHHLAIIERDIFIAVQHMISNAKYGRQSHLPNLYVIQDGSLKGFVSVNPKWASFKKDDYLAASVSVYEDIVKIQSHPLELRETQDNFDFSNYERTRTEFFHTQKKPCVLFSNRKLSFSTMAIQEIQLSSHVEILINPAKYQLLISPASEMDRNAVHWANVENSSYKPRYISGSAFLPVIYEMCGWNLNYKYRITGITCVVNNSKLLVFDLHDTEILIPTKEFVQDNIDLFTSRNFFKAYPAEWSHNFGKNYYDQLYDNLAGTHDKISLNTIPYYTKDNHVTSFSLDEIKLEIKTIISYFEKEPNNE